MLTTPIINTGIHRYAHLAHLSYLDNTGKYTTPGYLPGEVNRLKHMDGVSDLCIEFITLYCKSEILHLQTNLSPQQQTLSGVWWCSG